jgi:endonuclease III
VTAKKKHLGATDLGIELTPDDDDAIFSWLVACDLFGARISQDIAARAFHELQDAGVLTPHALAEADWQSIVDALGRGGYRRYDESTARELIDVGRRMVEEYGGRASRLRDDAGHRADVKDRVQEFAGIGPTAADIFVRDMAPVWGI